MVPLMVRIYSPLDDQYIRINFVNVVSIITDEETTAKHSSGKAQTVAIITTAGGRHVFRFATTDERDDLIDILDKSIGTFDAART